MHEEIKAYDGSQAEVGIFKAPCGTERRFFQHCKQFGNFSEGFRREPLKYVSRGGSLKKSCQSRLFDNN